VYLKAGIILRLRKCDQEFTALFLKYRSYIPFFYGTSDVR